MGILIKVKALMLIAVPVCGCLWAYAGADGTSKLWRRIGCGAFISLLGYIIAGLTSSWLTWQVWAVFPLLWVASSIGWGIPDSSDDGSPLGKMWFSILKRQNETRFNMSEQTHRRVNLAVRSTCAALYSLALVPLGVIGSWWTGGVFIFFGVVLFTAIIRVDHMIGKYNLEEFLVGAVIGAGAFLIVL